MVQLLKETYKLILSKEGLFLLAAFLVITALVLHFVHFDHQHPVEFFGRGEQALMHSQDKKKLLAAMAPPVLMLLGIFQLLRANPFLSRQIIDEPLEPSTPIERALRQGRLQPKLCN